MRTPFVVILSALLSSCLWPNPEYIHFSPEPLVLGPEKQVLRAKKPLYTDDEGARIQIDLGPGSEEKFHAFVYRTLDVSPAKAIHIEVCRAQSDCIPLRYGGMWCTRESCGASYGEPNSIGHGDTFEYVTVFSDQPIQIQRIAWQTGYGP